MLKNISKKTIIVAIAVVLILLLGLGIAGYFYLNNLKKTNDADTGVETDALKAAADAAARINDTATKGVLPDLQTNPLENKPDVNPIDKTNPFKDIKTNPFE